MSWQTLTTGCGGQRRMETQTTDVFLQLTICNIGFAYKCNGHSVSNRTV